MIYIQNGILFSHKKEWNVAICDNMDRPRGYNAKWNKSDWEKQIPYDFTYMWNLKKTKQTKQNRNRLRYRKQTGGHQRGGRWGVGQSKWRELRSTNLWNK